jgi:hypothetical protein
MRVGSPSVNVVCAVHVEDWPVAVSKKVTPMSPSWMTYSEFVKFPSGLATALNTVSGVSLSL